MTKKKDTAILSDEQCAKIREQLEAPFAVFFFYTLCGGGLVGSGFLEDHPRTCK